MKIKLEKPNHLKHPLRRIVRRERQGKTWFVVMSCDHAAPGRPASRFSRFYPCPVCYRFVELSKRSRAESKEDAMTAFRRDLRKRLTGGTFR